MAKRKKPTLREMKANFTALCKEIAELSRQKFRVAMQIAKHKCPYSAGQIMVKGSRRYRIVRVKSIGFGLDDANLVDWMLEMWPVTKSGKDRKRGSARYAWKNDVHDGPGGFSLEEESA
jgi:hypothetical protein